MSKGKRKIPKRCRWIGHHRWSCEDPQACTGDHVCLDCGCGPVEAYVGLRMAS